MINEGYPFLRVNIFDGSKDRQKFYCWGCGDQAGGYFGRFLRKLYIIIRLHSLKKIAAILLSALLLFYWSGYQLLFAYWTHRAGRAMESQFDNNEYDGSTLVSIKISARQLVYYNESVEFKRVDGVIMVGGVTYRYVKRRFFADSIELLCIPDGAEMRMVQARNELAGRTNNFHFPPSNGRPGIHLQKICWPAALHLLFRPFNLLGAFLADFTVPSPASGHDGPAERPPNGHAALS
jgi:hypothetical protein